MCNKLPPYLNRIMTRFIYCIYVTNATLLHRYTCYTHFYTIKKKFRFEKLLQPHCSKFFQKKFFNTLKPQKSV